MSFTLAIVCHNLGGVSEQDVLRWIDADLVRADRHGAELIFRELDLSRLRLIRELRDDLDLDEDALPIVLSLLDQLYDTRREMRRLLATMERVLSDDLRESVLRELGLTRTPD